MDVHGSQTRCMEAARWAEEVHKEVRAELSAMTLVGLVERAGAAGGGGGRLVQAGAPADLGSYFSKAMELP